MNIKGVSFGNQDFNALIAEPPATSPMAAAGMYEAEPDTFEKSGTGKTIAKTVIGLGVLAGALALLRGKTEALSKIDLEAGLKAQEGIWAKTKFVAAKAGQAVLDGAKHVQAIFSKKAKLEIVDKKLAKATSELDAAKTAQESAQKALNEAADDAKESAQKALEAANERLKAANAAVEDLTAQKTKLSAPAEAAAAEAPEAPAE